MLFLGKQLLQKHWCAITTARVQYNITHRQSVELAKQLIDMFYCKKVLMLLFSWPHHGSPQVFVYLFLGQRFFTDTGIVEQYINATKLTHGLNTSQTYINPLEMCLMHLKTSGLEECVSWVFSYECLVNLITGVQVNKLAAGPRHSPWEVSFHRGPAGIIDFTGQPNCIGTNLLVCSPFI